MENLEALANEAKAAIEAAVDGNALEQLRVDYLGKKGQITAQRSRLRPSSLRGGRECHGAEAVAA